MTRPQRPFARALSLAADLTLALPSLAVFRAARLILERAMDRHYRALPELARTWQVLGEETLRHPLALATILVLAPRWNPHAITAGAGPLDVSDSVAIRAATARASAAAWTFVVYSSPGHHTVAVLGSRESPGAEWASLRLPPGRYRLAMRYYRWTGAPELPAVRVDGEELVPSRPVPPGANDFYRDLARSRGPALDLFLAFLHAHARALLSLSRHFPRLFPRAFVDSVYVPVGNPETRFLYGPLDRGERMSLDLDHDLLATQDVYLTLYDRRSLPVFWCPLNQPADEPPRAPATGSYLVRAHPSASGDHSG
ncbi:MAG: hypothetical protein HY720_14425 [Planctomycetes bacterium]|nr:hypothetical protein [Planctomycetota bacterium]